MKVFLLPEYRSIKGDMIATEAAQATSLPQNKSNFSFSLKNVYKFLTFIYFQIRMIAALNFVTLVRLSLSRF